MRLPSEYRVAMHPFSVIHLDWISVLLPSSCLGGYGVRVALEATAPLVALLIVFLSGVLFRLWRSSRTTKQVSPRPLVAAARSVDGAEARGGDVRRATESNQDQQSVPTPSGVVRFHLDKAPSRRRSSLGPESREPPQ